MTFEDVNLKEITSDKKGQIVNYLQHDHGFESLQMTFRKTFDWLLMSIHVGANTLTTNPHKGPSKAIYGRNTTKVQ